MSSFQSCNYSIFDNEQKRFDNLLNICKKNNTGKTIIYSRYKYITLLFSKLFNFEIEFSFIHSKYNTKYTDDDLEKFKNGETTILLCDKILPEYSQIDGLTNILCYDIDYECLKFFNYNYNYNVFLTLLLLNNNNNSVLINLIKDDTVNISENNKVCTQTAIESM